MNRATCYTEECWGSEENAAAVSCTVSRLTFGRPSSWAICVYYLHY